MPPGPAHFFNTACQLVTTVNGDGALEPSGAGYTNRLPSVVTSPANWSGVANRVRAGLAFGAHRVYRNQFSIAAGTPAARQDSLARRLRPPHTACRRAGT